MLRLNDFVAGRRGDTIRGGIGNDTLIGDHGINTAPMETDMPQMINSIRLNGVDAAASTLSGIELNLPDAGQVIVPEFVAEPGDLVAQRPRWDRVTTVNPVLSQLANEDAIKTTDDLRIAPAVSIMPHFIGHAGELDGNDTIFGDAGTDLLYGDKMIVSSDLATGLTPVTDAEETAKAAVAGVMHALEGLALDQSVVNFEIDSFVNGNLIIEFGNDTQDSGDDDDMLVGDNSIYQLPAARTVPGAGSVADNALQLQQCLADFKTLADDASHLVATAHLSVIDRLLANAQATRPTLPAISGTDIQYLQHHQLVTGKDILRDDDGNDTLVGGDALFTAPIVTGTSADFPQTQVVAGLTAEEIDALQSQLREEARIDETQLSDRREARFEKIDQDLTTRF